MAWLPLASAQRGLYFAHELAPENPCYTTAEVVEVAGPLDASLLARAHELAYAEFPQLRTRFRATGSGPEQEVLDAAPGLRVVAVDSAEAAAAWVESDLARPMDLGAGDVVRAALLTLPGSSAWWFHAAHHVVLDGYGAQQLLRRVAELYTALSSGTAPVPAAGSSLEEVLADDAVRSGDPDAAAYWDARLARMAGGVSLAGRMASPAPRAIKRSVALADDVQRALVAGGRRLGAGWPDLFTAAVGGYLARMSGVESTRIGLPLMNRTLPGVGALPSSRTVCTAMNVLPATIPGAGAVDAALEATRSEQAALREHPFERQEDLIRRLDRRNGGQLFGAQVNLIPFELELKLGEATGAVRNLTAGPVEDLTICLRGTPGRGRTVLLEIDANPELYDVAEIDLHLRRLAAWLTTYSSAAASDDVAELPLLPAAERELVVATFNDTARERSFATLGERFAAQAARTPDAVALVFGSEQRTYAELLAAARRIAGELAADGVRAGDPVGVQLERGLRLYETIHGIALLGAVYMPLDPDLPAARLDAMLEDSGARHVIAESAHLDAKNTPTRRIFTPDSHRVGASLHADDAESAHLDTRNTSSRRILTPSERQAAEAEPFADVDAPAYLLFTSGSTGRPKGVLVGHRAIDNRLDWMQHHLPLGVGDRVLHKTPISFDVSVWELFWPLQVGATVVIAPPGAHRDPRAIADLVAGQRIDVLHFVPSMLRALLADRRARERVAEGSVRHVVTSGEALTPELVAGSHRWFGVAPTNLYGPTEAAIDVTCWDCEPGEASVPIGWPVWNTFCLVLDASGEPVPVGVVGELWLGGVQLADGYVGRPDLTAERFVETPFGRLYRTGDLATWRADGALRYLGRTDDQVKVHGQRIELGEIEAAVAGVPGLLAAAAGVVSDVLVCWYVAEPGSMLSSDPDRAAAALRAAAAVDLPASWLPSHWIPVAEIPLGTSGKTDRRTLAEIAPPAASPPPAAGPTVAPHDLLEQRLCELVADVLELPAVAPDDDFFALGGDSLRVLRLLSALDDELGLELSLADVFAHPTPAGLHELAAGDAERAGFAEVLTLRPVRPGRVPLVLLPPAGGLGWCYAGLLRSLPVDQGVLTVQAPGIAEGAPEPVADLTALAARQLAAIRSAIGMAEFHVGGWSLGGMAAHEVAAQARASGQPVGRVVLLDAYPSDQWQHLAEPTEEEALVGILRMGGVEGLLPPGSPIDRDIVLDVLRRGGSALAELPPEVLKGCLASVVEATRVVRTSRHAVLDSDLDVVVATAPRPERWLDASGWRPYVDGEVRTHPVDASHGDLVRRPVADEVGAILAGLLA